MSEPTNLTDRITHLRERKGGAMGDRGYTPLEQNRQQSQNLSAKRPGSERKMAADYFMWCVYGLLCIALGTQVALIFWLDVF